MQTTSTNGVTTTSKITVTRTPDGSGNVTGGKYNVVYGTASVTENTPNAVLSYELTDPTPPEIRFIGVHIAGEGAIKQMSRPTISPDGRMLTLIDANTVATTMNLTFKWEDRTVFEHDPQVSNVPHA
ncbi:MAG: hypothetical protein M3N23_00110 [Pseudomonadota bacterium]|nr:hypothetical protein [Pseudomonadota bacterium]